MIPRKILMNIIIFSLFIGVQAIAQNKILFTDTFTGADGNRPSNWEIISAPEKDFWYIQDSQFTTGNGDYIDANTSRDGYSYAILNVAESSKWSNYSIECYLWSLQKNGKALLVGRWRDRDNHYEATIETLEGRRILKIEKVLNGSRTILGLVEHGKEGVTIPEIENRSSPADAKQFKFIIYKNQLSLEFDKKLYIVVEDSDFTLGAPGLGEWYNFCYFDNFIVLEVNSPVSASNVVVSAGRQESKIKVEERSASTVGTLASTVYRISMGSNLPKDIADNLKTQLTNWGYTPVEIIKKGDKYEVLLGGFLSENEAASAKEFLTQEGLNPGSIIVESGKAAEKIIQKAAESPAALMYRVLVKYFDTDSGAYKLKDALENDGYYPVDVINIDKRYHVYIGRFNSKDEADKLASELVSDGYAFAKSEEEKAGGEVVIPKPYAYAAPTSKEDIVGKIQQSSPGLSQDQVSQIVKIIEGQRQAERGSLDLAQVKQLMDDFKQLDERVKGVVKQIQKKDEEERNLKIKISQIVIEVDRAIDKKDIETAEKKIAQLKEIDATNTIIPLKEKRVKQLKEGGLEDVVDLIRQEVERANKEAKEFESENNYDSSILQYKIIQSKTNPTSHDYQSAGREIGRLKALIADKEEKKRKEAQKQQYIIYGIAGAVVALVVIAFVFMIRTRKRDRELLKQVQELTIKPLLELTEGKLPKELQDLRKGQLPDLTGVKTPAMEALKSKAERDISAFADFTPKKPSTTTPITEPFEEEVVEKIYKTEKKAPPKEPPKKKKAPEPQVSEEVFGLSGLSSPSIFEEEVVLPAEIEKPLKPTAEPKIDLKPTPTFSEVEMPDLTISPREEEKEEVEAPVYQAPILMDLDDLLLDKSVEKEGFAEGIPELEEIKIQDQEAPLTISPEDIFMEDEAKFISQSAQSTKDIIEIPEIGDLEREVKESEVSGISTPIVEEEEIKKEKPETIRVAPTPITKKAEIPSKPEIEPVSQIAEGTIFKQDFDDDKDGTKPQNWKGDYDYSNLIVASDNPAPNSVKCLKFEKKIGAGSAYYYCKFPDVSGIIGVEFDLRCDNKNKYLLGFYIEKDEDFRQSIHTIIHKTDSSVEASLRLQGQPTPYKLGEWCRIKYIINLIEGTVDGYVNDKLVANRIRLATRPKCLNTLSIRDNLATTGVLLLDNIQIYNV